jgi:hypothetical protein
VVCELPLQQFRPFAVALCGSAHSNGRPAGGQSAGKRRASRAGNRQRPSRSGTESRPTTGADHVASRSTIEPPGRTADLRRDYRVGTGERVLNAAHHVLARRMLRASAMTSPDVVRELLFTKLADLGHQVFVALLIDSQHRLIEYMRTLSRHAGANQRLSPRGRQDRTCAQRRGDDLRAQPPVRNRGTQPGRRHPGTGAQAGTRRGRRSGAPRRSRSHFDARSSTDRKTVFGTASSLPHTSAISGGHLHANHHEMCDVVRGGFPNQDTTPALRHAPSMQSRERTGRTLSSGCRTLGKQRCGEIISRRRVADASVLLAPASCR